MSDSDIVQVRPRYSIEYRRRTDSEEGEQTSLIFVSQAHCNDEVCRYFSKRGNRILSYPPVWHRDMLMGFLGTPCSCGEQVRVETSPHLCAGEECVTRNHVLNMI